MSEETYKEIIEQYGDIFTKGQAFLDKPKRIISVSPALDIILGGGIPEGSYVVFSGNPKCGKTVLSLHFAGNAQKLGKQVFYFNIEGRLKERDLRGIQTLDATKVEVVESRPGNILTAEKYLQVAERLIRDIPGCIIILDSVSQLCTEKEQTNEVGELGRNTQGILMGNFCRKISNIVPVNNTVVISIAHLINNTGGMGIGYIETGGRKQAYQLDVKMRARLVEDWKSGTGEDAEQIGQIVTWETESTALNMPPGRKTKSYLRYGTGIDEMIETVQCCLSFGLISKSGAWFTIIEDGVEKKIQGENKLVEYCKEHPVVYQKFQSDLKSLVFGK